MLASLNCDKKCNNWASCRKRDLNVRVFAAAVRIAQFETSAGLQ